MNQFSLQMLEGRAVFFLALLAFLWPASAMSEEIKIGGTGNALGTVQMLAHEFSRKFPDTRVTVLSSLGSRGAIKAVPKGAMNIGVVSRPLTDEESASGLQAVEYARTPTVLAVSAKSGISSITREQIADIYAGRLTRWRDGTAIRPVLRQPGDDNTVQLRMLSPAIAAAVDRAATLPGLAFATTDQEAADMIESIPGAVGVTTIALLRSEKRDLIPLRLDGIEPNEKNCISGVYPIMKRFFFITDKTPTPGSRKFLQYVNSPEGRDVLMRTGHWFP